MKYLLIPVMILMFGISFTVRTEPPPPPGAEAARELEEARKAMQEATRRYAELAAGQADLTMREMRIHRVVAPRARLGVVVDPGADGSQGVVLRDVVAEGPAAKGDLQAGDVLVGIGDASLTGAQDTMFGNAPAWRVRAALADAGPGDEVVVRYLRDGAERSAVVVLGEAQPVPDLTMLDGLGERIRAAVGDGMQHFELWTGSPVAGLELVRMNEGLGRYFGTESGLLVVRAPAGNFMGLEGGDVILNIDGRVPESPVHAMRILRSYAPGEGFELDIMRERQRRKLETTIPSDGG